MCTLSFLQDILSARKLFLRTTQVKNVRIPAWPELAVKRIWPEAMELKAFRHYMPSEWTATNRRTERSFFYGVLTTLAVQFVEDLVHDC